MQIGNNFLHIIFPYIQGFEGLSPYELALQVKELLSMKTGVHFLVGGFYVYKDYE